MQNHYSSKGGHLTITERQLIEGWKKQWCYCQTFKKASQTIHNDIKRGLIIQQRRSGKFEKMYQADSRLCSTFLQH